MKKCVVYLLIFAFLLCSCGNSGGGERKQSGGFTKCVPDKIVLYEIEGKYSRANYSHEIFHDYDPSTHIDEVTAYVYLEKEYYTEALSNVFVYQYYKDSDTWALVSSGNWNSLYISYKAEKYEGVWNGDFGNQGGSFNMNLSDVDFENCTVTGYITAECSLFRNGHAERVTLTAEGTYPIERDTYGYKLRIVQNGCKFVFELSMIYGVLGKSYAAT